MGPDPDLVMVRTALARTYEQESVAEHTLPAHTETVNLPREPGTYAISLEGESTHGRLNTVFNVVVSP